jgi:hypothetical protein
MAGFEENPADEFEQMFCTECPKRELCTPEKAEECKRNYRRSNL